MTSRPIVVETETFLEQTLRMRDKYRLSQVATASCDCHKLEPDEIMPPPPGRDSDIATLWLGQAGYWYCPVCQVWHRDAGMMGDIIILRITCGESILSVATAWARAIPTTMVDWEMVAKVAEERFGPGAVTEFDGQARAVLEKAADEGREWAREQARQWA